jgi:hypothetical protein
MDTISAPGVNVAALAREFIPPVAVKTVSQEYFTR